MARHRHAMDTQDRSVGADAHKVMRFKGTSHLHARVNQGFDIAVPIFTPLRIEAHEALERSPDVQHALREFQQLQKRRIPGNDLQPLIDHRETLINQVKPRLKRFKPLRQRYRVTGGC